MVTVWPEGGGVEKKEPKLTLILEVHIHFLENGTHTSIPSL